MQKSYRGGGVIVHAEAVPFDRVVLYAWVAVASIKKRMERGNWLGFSQWVLRETVADHQGRRGGRLGETRASERVRVRQISHRK
ncbi:hypothetical protein [Candidatus Methylacidithermus pantelleriae]|uniref:hypothetical protein n=1 Tax=Candidatus Methylacidithermus pantelleriae TaxID=2744239 RepID=UPI00157C1F39|nr:hypothetical protein [Candidatus Methylacidithermus pantelleriae]